MIHPKANPTKDGTATRPTPHVAQTGDPSETVRRRVGRSPRSTPGAGEGRWRGARREATGLGMEDGGAWSATEGGRGWEGRWRGARRGAHEDGGERDGRRMGGEGRRKGVGGAHGCVDACAADMLVTRTWLHHKHHCRLLRVSAQVERSMGGGSAAPCFAEARWEVSGAAGLIRWSWVSKKCAMHATDGQVVAETAGLLRRAHGCTTSIIAGCSGSVHK